MSHPRDQYYIIKYCRQYLSNICQISAPLFGPIVITAYLVTCHHSVTTTSELRLVQIYPNQTKTCFSSPAPALLTLYSSDTTVCLSLRLSVSLSFYLSVCLYVCLSIFCMFAYLSVYLSARLSVCPSICLYFIPSFCPSVCLSVFLYVRLSDVRASDCLYVCLYVRLDWLASLMTDPGPANSTI